MASNLKLEPLKDEAIIDIHNDVETQYKIFKLGIWDSIQFKLWGHVEVGSISRGGAKLEAHLIRCDVHGYQVTTPSGHYELLLCPACLKERAEKKPKRELASKTDETELNPLKKYLNKNLGNNK